MKAIILLATLKKKEKSNTQTLIEFFGTYLNEQNIEYEIVKLAKHTIVPGTYTQMKGKDDWPVIYQKILDADIILFATPIWWNNHSSELQRAIERLDEVYDIILSGKPSPLEGKVGGVLITGDSDGGQHITANIASFFGNIGVLVPPYSSLAVMWEGHEKNVKKTNAQLLKYYKREYATDAKAMAASLAKYSKK